MKRSRIAIHITCLVLFLSVLDVAGQSKKEQIEILNARVDSLRNAINSEIEKGIAERVSHLAAIDSLKHEMSAKEADLQKTIKGTKAVIKDLNDSLSFWKSEHDLLRDFIEWSGALRLDEIKRFDLGNIVAFRRNITEYSGGVPDEVWNGDSWNHDVFLYYLKENGRLRKVNLQDCFKSNSSELLAQINRIAKKQYDEYMSSGSDACGGSIRFPLFFSDLTLHLNDEINGLPSFEIMDVGIPKGNVCGSPPDMVEIDRNELLKYLK